MTRTTYPTNFKNTSMKLEATELRVGNIFWEDYGGYKVVTAINCNRVGDAPNSVSARAINNTVSGQFSCDAIQPVPLTPEILEKSGFSGGEWKSIKVDTPEGFLNKDGYFEISVSPTDSVAVIEVDPYGNNSDSIETISLPNEIKYLHQLQNLYFALTGTELTINL